MVAAGRLGGWTTGGKITASNYLKSEIYGCVIGVATHRYKANFMSFARFVMIPSSCPWYFLVPFRMGQLHLGAFFHLLTQLAAKHVNQLYEHESNKLTGCPANWNRELPPRADWYRELLFESGIVNLQGWPKAHWLGNCFGGSCAEVLFCISVLNVSFLSIDCISNVYLYIYLITLYIYTVYIYIIYIVYVFFFL